MRGRIRKTRFRGGRTSGSLAEWSKALASGASPKGRAFESHSCHSFARVRFWFLITKGPKPPPSISHYSLVVERQLCKLKAMGSIPSPGIFYVVYPTDKFVRGRATSLKGMRGFGAVGSA